MILGTLLNLRDLRRGHETVYCFKSLAMASQTKVIVPFSGVVTINELDILMKSGKRIDTIYTVKSHDDEQDITKEPYKCIGDLFEGGQGTDRYYFGTFDDEYTSLYSVADPNYSETDGRGRKKKNYLNRYSNRFSDNNVKKIKDSLISYRKVAEFGDIAAQQTRVDENVRKGFDIVIDQNDVKTYITDKLHDLFYEKTGIRNVRIEPYKINIYEKGDFFAEHRDSPSKDLIATIVVHVDGEYGSMVVDGEIWQKDDGNVLIFYSDVLHEVKPVKEYRETMTFKVFTTKSLSDLISSESDGSKMIFSSGIGESAQGIAKRIDIGKQFGILLQNGYTYLNIGSCDPDLSDEETLKGVDNQLIAAIKQLGLKYRFVPVIVKDIKTIDRHSSYYDDDSDDDTDIEYDERTRETVKTSFRPSRKIPSYEGLSDEISNLEIFNICPELQEKVQNKTEVPPMPVYYLGKGFRVGEKTRRNVYIGNDYSGHVEENIYLNVLLVID